MNKAKTNTLLLPVTILVILACAPGAVHAQVDPFGGGTAKELPTDDPFGSADDPFGSGADPFGDRDSQPADGNRTRAAILDRGIRQAKEMVEYSDQDTSFLEGSLSLLQHYGLDEHGDVHSASLLEGIAQRWHTRPGVTTKQLRERLRTMLVSDPSNPEVRGLRQLGTQYAVSFDIFDDAQQDQDRNWSLDWRKQQVFWLDLVELMLRSLDGENVASAWRGKVTVDATHADWYRLACLVLMSEETAERDLPFVSPLVREDLPVVDRRWRLAYLRVRLQEIDLPEDDAARVQTRERLFALLREHPLRYSNASERELLTLLGTPDSYRANSRRDEELLADVLVQHSDPRAFETFADAAGFSPRDELEWYLAKRVTLACDDEPVAAVLNRLGGQVCVPLWIDNAVQREAVRVTLEPTSGTWWEVLHRVLEKTEYRLHLFQDSVLWIGKPSDLRGAQDLLGSSLTKIPRGHTESSLQTEQALRDKSRMEFIETPLKNACEFLSDVHDVNFLPLDQHDRPVSFDAEGVPLHLGLTLLCADNECEWAAVGGTIAMGPPDKVARFGELTLKRLQRAVRWKRLHNPVTEALQEYARFDFIETPLDQVAEFLSDQNDIPVKVADDDRDVAVTMKLRGLTFSESLDVLTFVLGLTWDADGQAIYMGSPKQIKAMMQGDR